MGHTCISCGPAVLTRLMDRMALNAFSEGTDNERGPNRGDA